jgi:hypothetical protein
MLSVHRKRRIIIFDTAEKQKKKSPCPFTCFEQGFGQGLFVSQLPKGHVQGVNS